MLQNLHNEEATASDHMSQTGHLRNEDGLDTTNTHPGALADSQAEFESRTEKKNWRLNNFEVSSSQMLLFSENR